MTVRHLELWIVDEFHKHACMRCLKCPKCVHLHEYVVYIMLCILSKLLCDRINPFSCAVQIWSACESGHLSHLMRHQLWPCYTTHASNLY